MKFIDNGLDTDNIIEYVDNMKFPAFFLSKDDLMKKNGKPLYFEDDTKVIDGALIMYPFSKYYDVVVEGDAVNATLNLSKLLEYHPNLEVLNKDYVIWPQKV